MKSGKRKSYKGYLKDSKQNIIVPQSPNPGKRDLINAGLFLADNGCKWRNLLRDFPPNTTVPHFYYAAIKSGLWRKIRAALVESTCTDDGRNPQPNYSLVNFQSVKTTRPAKERRYSGENRGADAGYRGAFVRQVEEGFGSKVDISETNQTLSVGKTTLAVSCGTHL